MSIRKQDQMREEEITRASRQSMSISKLKPSNIDWEIYRKDLTQLKKRGIYIIDRPRSRSRDHLDVPPGSLLPLLRQLRHSSSRRRRRRRGCPKPLLIVPIDRNEQVADELRVLPALGGAHAHARARRVAALPLLPSSSASGGSPTRLPAVSTIQLRVNSSRPSH